MQPLDPVITPTQITVFAKNATPATAQTAYTTALNTAVATAQAAILTAAEAAGQASASNFPILLQPVVSYFDGTDYCFVGSLIYSIPVY